MPRTVTCEMVHSGAIAPRMMSGHGSAEYQTVKEV